MTDKTGNYLLVHPAMSLEAFRGVAQSLRLLPREGESGTKGGDYTERWSDGDVVVEWLEVERLGCTFVWFVSPHPDATRDHLKSSLRASTREELVTQASSEDVGHDELVDLVYQVAYMTPEADDEVLELFAQRMEDPRPTIRRATLNGYMIRRWPALKDKVEELAASDEDEAVQATAERALGLG